MNAAAELTNQIIDFIYRAGGYAWRASSVGIYDTSRATFRTSPKKGVSDVLGCYKGRLIAVEIKIGSDHLRPEQQGFMECVNHAGGAATVVKTFDEFVAWWAASVVK